MRLRFVVLLVAALASGCILDWEMYPPVADDAATDADARDR